MVGSAAFPTSLMPAFAIGFARIPSAGKSCGWRRKTVMRHPQAVATRRPKPFVSLAGVLLC